MNKQIKNQPWHKLPEENFLQYRLFLHYLELIPEERTFLKVEEETGYEEKKIRKFANKFHWNDRVTAYDEHVRLLQEQQYEKTLQRDAINAAHQRSRYRDKEQTLAKRLIATAEQMLSAPLYESTVDQVQIINGQEVVTHMTVKPARWTMDTPRRYIQAAAELMRLNLEMETARIGVVNKKDPNYNLQMARASLEKLTEDIDHFVDQQLELEPNANREELKVTILKLLPEWVAADWRLSSEQIPLLTEAIQITPLPQVKLIDQPSVNNSSAEGSFPVAENDLPN